MSFSLGLTSGYGISDRNIEYAESFSSNIILKYWGIIDKQ